MNQSIVSDQEQLKTQALWLSQYLISNNEFRMEADMNLVEQVMEDDFINLNEMALNV